jgi:hypothetical protein
MVIATRVKCGLPVSKKQLKESFALEANTLELISALKETDQEKSIPKQYRTKEGFIGVYIKNFLEYEDEYPDKVEYLGTIDYNGEELMVYKHVYSYDESEEYAYLALVGNVTDPIDVGSLKGYCSWEELTEEWQETAKKEAPDWEEYGYN